MQDDEEQNMAYIFTMLILFALYGAVIYAMKYMGHGGKWNLLFTAAVFVPYVVLCFVIYSDVGFYDWNFQNVLPVANVSPFMFTLTGILTLLPNKSKKPVYGLISLLSVGMMISTVVNCVYNAMIHYKFHWHFVLDYVAHFALSAYGVYLVKSGQVDLRLKKSLFSGALIVGAAIVMMVANVIFDTSFFGLSLSGKHNIYNVVLVKNSYLSAAIYFAGLSLVLLLGYLYSRNFSPVSMKKERKVGVSHVNE